MHKEILNNLSFFVFDHLFSHKELYHAVTTRAGGLSPSPYKSLNLGINTDDKPSNIISNHDTVSRALNFDLSFLISSIQVHKDRTLCLKQKPKHKESKAPGVCYKGFDSIITDQNGITIMIRIADCVPVILYDPKSKVLAVVHAGWKGTLSEITIKTIHQMKKQFGCFPADIKAGIGPAIGKCCFSVNREVAEKFTEKLEGSEYFVSQNNSSSYIDLKKANRIQMILAGLKEKNIEISELCTSCSSDIFFSHRREKGRTGRFALLAGLHSF
jgi:hypothetical protein